MVRGFAQLRFLTVAAGEGNSQDIPEGFRYASILPGVGGTVRLTNYAEGQIKEAESMEFDVPFTIPPHLSMGIDKVKVTALTTDAIIVYTY